MNVWFLVCLVGWLVFCLFLWKTLSKGFVLLTNAEVSPETSISVCMSILPPNPSDLE